MTADSDSLDPLPWIRLRSSAISSPSTPSTRRSCRARRARARRPKRSPRTCGELGLDVHLQEAAPGRPNVIGVLDGAAPGRSLMFCGHIDTVGVEGMARAVRSASSATAGCTAADRRT